MRKSLNPFVLVARWFPRLVRAYVEAIKPALLSYSARVRGGKLWRRWRSWRAAGVRPGIGSRRFLRQAARRGAVLHG
jgi:hypothetical protein